MLNHTSDIFTRLKNQLNILTCCRKWLPHGRRSGNEWVCTNPRRHDNREGSFSVNIYTGCWSDFALSDAKGGDVISLYAYLNSVQQIEAAQRLEQEFCLNVIAINPNKNLKKMPIINTYIPIPSHAPLFQAPNNQGFWDYFDKNGNSILYLTRHDNPENKKSFKPHTFANVDGIDQWIQKGLYKNGQAIREKPLYNLHLLSEYPDAQILLVEGEKTADSANGLLNNHVCMSWLGGAQCADKVDLEPLRDRVVWLWPDNDEPGIKAMLTIKRRLSGIAKECHIVDLYPLGKLPKGWDLADCTDDLKDKLASCFVKTESNNLIIDVDIDPQSFPDLSSKFRPLNTTNNIAYLLEKNDITVRYNLMTNYPEFYKPGYKFSRVNEFDCYMTEIGNLCVKAGVPKINLDEHIAMIAERHCYHPAIEFIESKNWDGVSRVSEFLSTIISENKPLSDKLIYRWMLGCIAAAYSTDGICLDGVLVIQGEQRIGKSRWFTKLVPEKYQYLIKGEQILDPNNKDSVMNCTNCWLTGLNEFDATTRKSHVSAQKTFFTQSVDYYRVPFGKRIRPVPRRTAMYASVNPQNFLADDTGNRRFWTVKATSINHNHEIDMQQVWAEFKILFDKGESFRLSDEEHHLLNDSNKDFELIEPLEEKFLASFCWDDPQKNLKTCTEILIEMGYERPNRSEANKLATILKKMNIQKGTGRMRRSYYVPKIKIVTQDFYPRF